MQEKILILDFGSQFTQLIARRVRELNIYCEIHPFNKVPEIDSSVKGIILSGSPYSVRQEDAPHFDFEKFHNTRPILGVCYGAQYIAHFHGGEVLPSSTREYGRANLEYIKKENPVI
jgi:GMP synthase (glutamine-hydrolysing)